jgi:hypothetical protein
MVLINSLKENRRNGDVLSVVESYAAITGCAINVILTSYAKRNTSTAGRNNEENLAGEIEGQTLFP